MLTWHSLYPVASRGLFVARVELGVTFPGDLSYGQPFSSLSHLPNEAWDVVPYAGKLQMLVFIGCVESWSEAQKVRGSEGSLNQPRRFALKDFISPKEVRGSFACICVISSRSL